MVLVMILKRFPLYTGLSDYDDWLSKRILNFLAMNPPTSPKIGIKTIYNAK